MTSALKRAAILFPPIRRLKEQRDAALRQVAELSSRLGDVESGGNKAHVNTSFDLDELVNRSVDKTLSTIRAEFTPLPRFAYHIPLDHEMRTLPPQFDPPVWVDGEPLLLPPPAERHGHDDSKYLEWGRYDHDVLLGHIRRELPSVDNLAVMDFGCSSGRVLRHFLGEMREHGWRLTGVDVSARRIEWMRRNFPPEFQVYTGSALPILPFESNTFDVIYGLSVFTHMKFLWDTWLLEMRRVLKPGGLLIQTIHTENAWNFFVQHSHEDWARNALGPMVMDAEKLSHDFVYFGDVSYNQVFWKKEIALDFWSRYFADVTIFPPPEQYWYQDWVVARKPKSDQPPDRHVLDQRIAEFNRGRLSATERNAMVSGAENPARDQVPNKNLVTFSIKQDFSQHGEQQIIIEFFSRLPEGINRYCVDAGAYDGVVGSNSRALFLNGWRGVVIEPNPRAFARLEELYADRPDVICVQKALSDHRRENVPMKFAVGPPGTQEEDKWKYAQVSTLHDSWAASIEKQLGWVYETSTVATDTLTNILREVGAPKDIAFLSIDCEGEDLNVIKRLDLKNFRPLLICIEADDASRHFYAEIIEPRGYTIHARSQSNTFFRLNTLLIP